jgi:hypothetical protein
MNKGRLASTLLVVAGLVGVFASRAGASLVLAMDVGELARSADHIAVADVVAVRSAWDDKHQKIYTTVDLSVVESWKGGAAPASRMTVVQPGGTVGDITMAVFGLSRFVPGERALLFLRGTPAKAGVVGMTQGKRPVRRDGATGRWIVDGPDRAGAELVSRPGAKSAAPSDDHPRPLDDLRSQVRDELLKANLKVKK